MSDTDKNDEIPKLGIHHHRKKQVSTITWMDNNEYYTHSLWTALQNYIDDSNRIVLDKCTYPQFCEFVAKNTTIQDPDISYEY